MDKKVMGFSFLNPGLYFAYQLKNILTQNSHVCVGFPSPWDTARDDILSSYDFEKEQGQIYRIMKSCGQERQFVDLTRPPIEIKKFETLSSDIVDCRSSMYQSGALSRITKTTRPLHYEIHKLGYISKNKKQMRSPPRKHIRGPRRFTSVVETVRTIFS